MTDIPLVGQSNAQIYVEIPVRKDKAWEEVRRGHLACINYVDDKELADHWLPKREAPQVKSGIKLYNVADADNPTKAINAYKSNVKKFNRLKLQPPLE